MPAPRPMTDEQRKAMFARLRGAGVSVYDATGRNAPEAPSAWDKTWEAMKGWHEGAGEGNENVLNALTFGLTDNLGLTHTYEQSGTAAELSKMFAGIGSGALYAAAGQWLGGMGAALEMPGIYSTEAGILSAVGGFQADHAIDQFRDNVVQDPYVDKLLAVLGEVAGYYGGYGAVKAARGVIGTAGAVTGWGEILGGAAGAAGSAIEGLAGKGWAAIESRAPTLAKALKEAYKAYTAFSETTGASWNEFGGDSKWKTAFLSALAVGRTAADEWQAHKGKQEALDAWSRGENYTIDMPDARGTLGTVLAGIIGTTGNPIEKQTRYGLAEGQKEVGAWRAAHEILDKQYAAGEITSEQYNAGKRQLNNNKPFKEAGNTVWSGVSAASTYAKWKVEDMMKTLDRQSFGTVQEVLDGDTVKVQPRNGGESQTFRVLGIDTPEIAHNSKETADYMGNEAWANAQSLLPVGSTVMITRDSHAKAAGQDVHGRELGSVTAVPGMGSVLSAIPGIASLAASSGTDLGADQLEKGLAGIRYTKLSGKTDKGIEYEQLQKAAQASGVGIWAPEAQGQNKSWVGNEPTYSDLYKAPQQTTLEKIQTPAGAGLMITGNSGALGSLGQGAGGGIAQAWNAALAVMGTLDYNRRAEQASDRVVRPPATYQSDYDKRAYEIIHGSSLPTPAEYDRRAAEILAGK